MQRQTMLVYKVQYYILPDSLPTRTVQMLLERD